MTLVRAYSYLAMVMAWKSTFKWAYAEWNRVTSLTWSVKACSAYWSCARNIFPSIPKGISYQQNAIAVSLCCLFLHFSIVSPSLLLWYSLFTMELVNSDHNSCKKVLLLPLYRFLWNNLIIFFKIERGWVIEVALNIVPIQRCLICPTYLFLNFYHSPFYQ